MNWMKTFLLMGALTALFMLIGNMFGGRSGMIFAFVLAAGMNFMSYWFSDKIVLTMYRAKPVSEAEAPDLYRTVEGLARQAGLPMPKLYVMQTDMPNAFATGRNPDHTAVAVTSGLMRMLNSEEIEGVIAHELAHVKNRDILIGTIAATMAGAIMMLASMARWAAIFGGSRGDDDEGGGAGLIGLLAITILAPFAALVIQMMISRSREYLADSSGAQISGKPLGLANALLKLERGNELPHAEPAPATAHMFIVSPLSGRSISSLFSTHPPIKDRVAKLRAMSDSYRVG
ncbi:MAG: zinc metalloprotease HtpX [Armatimonadetes bacterium]|nr:zinc metalloprotease HtpX [Armatimonadota bacterium]